MRPRSSLPAPTLDRPAAAPTLDRPAATIGFDGRYINDRYHGIGRHAHGLLEALSRSSSHDQFVVYYNPADRNTRFDLQALGQRPNVRLRSVPLPLFSPLAQVAWPAILFRDRIDVFHSPYVDVPILALPPVLPTVHDLIFEQFPEYMPQRQLRLLYTSQMQLALRRAPLVMTVSEATRRDIQALYPIASRKVRVIGNAVGDDFSPEHDERRLENVRTRYNLPPRFMLAVGAGRPHKNIGVLVDAFDRLGRESRGDLRIGLVLAGEVDTRFNDDVADQIARRRLTDEVVRIGPVREQDLKGLYSLAEVLVFPSLIEGFGLPVLEAMACGTPVLASSRSSMPEVAGNAAILFDPQNATNLASELSRVLTKPELRADLARRGRVQAHRFTWDVAAKATLSVYSDALAARASHVRGRLQPSPRYVPADWPRPQLGQE